MRLGDFIKNPADIREIESLRRTMLVVFEPFGHTNDRAMEILESLWAIPLSELFGTEEQIKESKRSSNIIRRLETSEDLYDFTNVSALQLRGGLNDLWNDAIENKPPFDIVEFYFLILRYFNADTQRSYEDVRGNIFWTMENMIREQTGADEKESKHFVREVYREIAEQVAKEVT